MRLPRTNFPHGLDNAGELRTSAQEREAHLWRAGSRQLQAIGENADEIAAGQIEGRIEAPIWQSNFVIGPNVRFHPARRRMRFPSAPGWKRPRTTMATRSGRERDRTGAAGGGIALQPVRPAAEPALRLSFLHAAFTPPADSPLHEHAAARGALALALRLRRALEAEEAQNKGLVIDAEAHRTPVTEVTAEAPDQTLKPPRRSRPDLLPRCRRKPGHRRRLAPQPAAEATAQDEATTSIPLQDVAPETHAAAQLQPEQDVGERRRTARHHPPADLRASAGSPARHGPRVGSRRNRARGTGRALPDFLFFEALACNPDLGFDDLPRPRPAPPNRHRLSLPPRPRRQAKPKPPTFSPRRTRHRLRRRPVHGRRDPAAGLDAQSGRAYFEPRSGRLRRDRALPAIDCRASAPLFPLLSAPQPAPASADARRWLPTSRRPLSMPPGHRRSCSRAVAETLAPAAPAGCPLRPCRAPGTAARNAAPVDFNRLPFSIPRAALWADSGDDYDYPPVELLQEPPVQVTASMTQEALEQSAGLLESVLEDFGVRGEIIDVRPGPVVTLYEFEPAPGVKSSRVIGLSDDIARSMSALSARVAVVPGRNVIGIELPNPCARRSISAK